MEPLKLGLVGLGGMGRSHLEKESALDDVTFTAVADVVKASVDEVSARYEVSGFTDYKELIDSGRCEAVLIATPHPFHAPVAEYATSRGVHVLSEKPIAVAVSEADRMIDAAERAGTVLGVMFQLRNEPVYRKAKDLLDAGAVGEIYRSTMIANAWYRSQAYYDSGSWRGTWTGEGGGVLMNQSPHSLDLFIWLGGMPRRVTAQVETRFHHIEVEDSVSALLEYDGSHTGYFYTTTAEWPGENRMEFVGDRGKLVIQDNSLRLYRLTQPLLDEIRTGSMWGKPSGAWEDVPLDPSPTGHSTVVRQFARAIRLGEPLVATARDGLRSLELANAMLLSGYQKKTVDVPLDRAAYDAFLAEKRAAGA